MNQKVVRKYCRQVSRNLICLPRTKKMLMQGLMEELDDHPGTLSDLEDRFGKAADVAAELQESVPMDEFNQMMQMRKRRTFLLIGATLTIVALGVCFMILYYMHAPYYITSFTQEG